MTPRPIPVVINTDPGVDDALAILFALASPELDVAGIITVFGNADVSATTRNAFAVGAAAPLAGRFAGGVPHVHGSDGLGDGGVSSTRRAAGTTPVLAAEFIWQAVAARPGQVTVLALGPLTNLALQLRRELPRLVGRVVMMGGNALVSGNATLCAEANMHSDPEAADLVFGAGWPVTVVGLDVTQKVNLAGSAIERITTFKGAPNALLAGALPLYRSFFERTNGINGIFLHDLSAVAFLVDPSLFEVENWPVRVEESFRQQPVRQTNLDGQLPPISFTERCVQPVRT